MESTTAQAEFDLELVATDDVATVGCWFYFSYFYASPAMLVERDVRMT